LNITNNVQNMKQTTSSIIALFFALLVFVIQVHGFASVFKTSVARREGTSLYFFGQPKDDGSPGDYVCKDCGYVFTKGPAAWAALDKDTYKCPPCGGQ
jgi:DNA-directed RNA polymerase subunit RPC12/RpoP